MAASDRENFIVDFLSEHNYADVGQLSEMLQVSDMTIRRDLDRLEEKDLLVRVHGGASISNKKMLEFPLDTRQQTEKEEKHRLAKYAASLVEDGDAIAVDSSSTTYAMVPFLNKDITVITTHIATACALACYDKVRVILLGGILRKDSMSVSGKSVELMMKSYCVDKAFLSSKALDTKLGATDATIDEGETKKVIIEASKQVFFLYDHTKLNTSAFYHVAKLADMETIIVDEKKVLAKAQPELFEMCQKNNVRILYANRGGE